MMLAARRQAIMVIGAFLLPIIVIAVVQVANGYRQERQAVEQAALAEAHRIIGASDARLETQLAAAMVLSTTPPLAAGDWASAKARAEELQVLFPDWRAVRLEETTTGAVLFDTARTPRPALAPPPLPPGASRPATYAVNVAQAGCNCVRIELPAGAAARYRLLVDVDTSGFQAILMQELPAGVVAALVDRRGAFIARSIDYPGRVGTPATQYVRAAVARGGSGVYPGRTFEGLVNYTAYVTSPRTGWSTHIAVDRKLIDHPMFWSNAALALGTVVVLAIALGLLALALADRAAQRQRQERLLQLQKAEAIGQFTSGIAHDFNNLLMVMIGNLDRIAADPSGARVPVLAERALTAARRGSRLSNQLLSFARGGGGAQIDRIDLAMLFDQISELIRESVSAGVAVTVHVAEDARWVFANGDQVERAVLNMAVNARDAMEGAGELSFAARRDDDWVELSVADRGPGLPPGPSEQLFEAFFSTKPVGKGTGLGLAQVAGAVHQAGGTITAANRPGGGALFLLRFRAAPAADEREGAAP